MTMMTRCRQCHRRFMIFVTFGLIEPAEKNQLLCDECEKQEKEAMRHAGIG